jgi:hypothetical protein
MGQRKTGVERMEQSKRVTGVNVAELYKLGASITECTEIVIAAPGIESLIEHAEDGDKAAAKEVLALASAYLNHEILGQMPLKLRRYLGNALAKASLGESADVTLNLKREGRPRQEHRTKLSIGLLIHTAMQSGKSLEEACFDCQDFFEANIEARGQQYGYTKTPDPKTLERIYCEVLPEIKAIYKEVLSATST